MNGALSTNWRGWHAAFSCPICGGWPFAGRSAKHCSGGFRLGKPTVVFCSVVPSPIASRTGKTFRHDLPTPIVYVEPPAGSLSLRSERPSGERPAALPYALVKDPEHAWRPVARWDYRRADGSYAFSVRRFHALDPATAEPVLDADGRPLKSYRAAIALDPADLRTLFVHHVPSEKLLPYRLPHLLAAIREDRPIVFQEGERCVDFLVERFPNYASTTAAGGALRFEKTGWLPHLRGLRRAHVLVDRDAAGRAWARSVLGVLRQLDPLPVVSLWQSATPGEGDDLIDHLEAGHRLDAMVSVKQEEL